MRFFAPVVFAAALVASLAAPARSQQVFVMDMDGNGLDLSGPIQNNPLFRPNSVPTRWTLQGSDDCFLALDATAMRAAGLDVRDAAQNPVDGMVLVQGGMSIAPVGTPAVPASDVWDVVAMLDSNHDQQVDANDAAYAFTYLYMGPADPDSLTAARVDETKHRPPVVLFTWGTRHGAPVTDAAGNVRRDGTGMLNGQPCLVSGVTLFGGVTPGRKPTWGDLRKAYR